MLLYLQVVHNVQLAEDYNDDDNGSKRVNIQRGLEVLWPAYSHIVLYICCIALLFHVS